MDHAEGRREPVGLMPHAPCSRRHAAFALLLLLCLVGLNSDAHEQRLQVTVTAYAGGTITASGRRPQPGMIALSRDVERALGVRFGDRVHLAGLGTFVFHDRMPRQWSRRVDLYLASRHAARQFGRQHALLRRGREAGGPG
jgi:3D (Asp-Asp-Asp) domain-containing protein